MIISCKSAMASAMTITTATLTPCSWTLPLPLYLKNFEFRTPPQRSSFRLRDSVNGVPSLLPNNTGQQLITESLNKTLTEGATADADSSDELYSTAAACPLPDFAAPKVITLINPCKTTGDCSDRPLLVYVPGMDCTGQGIVKQLPHLLESGYDIRCVYIPNTDRTSWTGLVERITSLLRKEIFLDGKARDLTLLGESFGGALALRLCQAAPDIISQLVLVNPATNFQKSSPLASAFASTGFLSLFPESLYKTAQDILLPLMVNWDRVKIADHHNIFSPVDLVPAECAAWRFSLLNDDAGLNEANLKSIRTPTLLISSSEDHVVSSIEECGRLQRLLLNSKRVILPNSGHTALLEDSINICTLMEMYGFLSTKSQRCPISVDVVKDVMWEDRMDELGQFIGPWRALTSPLISGEENLPNPQVDRPILFVGNHTMFGFYDTPLLFYELFLRGFRCRGLAHAGHWRTGVGQFFERYGHVKATKIAAYKLLKDKQHVLLFPGGAREVFKKKGEEYKLMWRPTVDFVRMASRFDTIIVPFGMLGGDEAYKILYDGDDLLKSPIAPLIKELYKRLDISLDMISPVTAFPGTNLPSMIHIPDLKRIYFHFAEPIDTKTFQKDVHGQHKYEEMYSTVKGRVEQSISLLKTVRSNDKRGDIQKRLLGKILDRLPEFNRS